MFAFSQLLVEVIHMSSTTFRGAILINRQNTGNPWKEIYKKRFGFFLARKRTAE